MNIGRFSIKNKYFILSVAIAIVIFGIYSRISLKTQLSPDTNAPTVTVITQYPGASSQDVVKDVVEPMEDEFGKLEGISNIKSTSQDNIAVITLEFSYATNIDEAAIDIQNAISRIRNKLPSNMGEPKVLKFSTSDKPVLTLSLNSNSVDLRTVRQIAEDEIGFSLQLLDGIASVDIFGGYKSLVKVNVDKNRLNSYGLTLEQVSSLLAQNNIKAPGGKLTDANKEVLIRIEEDLKTTNDIENIRIPLKDGNAIYLKDIAEVEFTTEDLESNYRYNGNEGIALLVLKRSDANTVEVVEDIIKEVEVLKDKYPFIQFEIAQDDSIFTNQMVDNMSSSVLMSMVFTIILIMLFISNVSQSLVVSMSMPLVFLTTLALMKFFDMKLDMVTLSALILSIGFVVDASIVVVENIVSHRNQNKDIIAAAIDGTNEIAMANIAGATTTLVVLIPLLFIEGFVGEIFRPLSLTVIFAIGSSILISLLIIPLFTVMLSKFEFAKAEKLIDKISLPWNKLMAKLSEFYISVLKLALKNKVKTILIALVLLVLSGRFLANNGMEMLPQFDSGKTFVSVEMEPGTRIEETSRAVEYIENFLAKEEIVINYDAQIGYERDSNMLSDFGVMSTNQALLTINLTTRIERDETIWEFQERLRDEIKKIPGIKRYSVKEQGGTASSSAAAPIDIKISGADQEILYNIADKLQQEIAKVEGTTNLYKSFNVDNLQMNIIMNESRIQELGLTNAQVANQIYNSMEGIVGTDLDIDESDNVGISVEYMDEYKESADSLLDTYINAPLGVKVPLRELADIELNERANLITREDLEYTIDILGYTHSRAFSHITKDINKIIKNYPVPSGYAIELTGEQQSMSDSAKDMMFLLSLSVILVYLILVPQFKSFMQPVTVMASIPLVVIGIAPALGLTGKYISMPVLLGFILLVGTVVNNAILLVEFINERKKEGIELNEAITQAVKSRFRPIMMTALSDITGMIPLAAQLALGSERFSPLAIAVIGGMTASTFLTMVIIPVIYASFEGTINKFNKALVN
ncbi:MULTISPECIES: efflux RND transporter permease subunit [unclassified Sedimentibacter]|uniref:efflux RND transporter permease subunit n=1 Tax=unclassified Sedimentibacter TaxID=2649220 RepID=UPI0027DFD543|nr:efflux RND transporter permease subunit [Sedimentibacter sp. MB35-C1]WMJ76924.1 efflux RND transporter permease subunit [Sedimentibacter sp. MB35-C1]